MLTLAQLQELGLSGRAVRDRAASGRLQRLHRGVFAAEGPTRQGRWMAAVLVAGPGAVLSHRSAAALWGVHDDRRALVEVTVPRSTRRSHVGVEIHSGRTLGPDDVSARDRIPCTTLPRTLVDLAATVDRRTLVRAIDRAEELRAFDLRAVEVLLAHSRRRGVRALAAALAEYAGPTATRSEAEERLLAVVRSAGLPAPAVNAWIALPYGGGYSPDFLWRSERLVVEVDGRAYHARREAFVHDRLRDRRLALAGFETHRYAASEVLAQPHRVALELRAFLDARGRTPSPTTLAQGASSPAGRR